MDGGEREVPRLLLDYKGDNLDHDIDNFIQIQ